MPSKREKEIAWALQFRRELSRGGLSRRELMRLGVFSAGTAFLGLQSRWAGADVPVSPPTRPFVDPIYYPQVLAPVANQAALEADGGAVIPAAHQYYNRFQPQKFYRIRVRANYNFFYHSDLPLNLVWGYNGSYPGPTLDFRYGEPVLVRVHNDLPTGPSDFGIPQVITHLHNFHSASESDGGPWLYYDPGHHLDHHYTLARAGFTDPVGSPTNPYGNGDPRETLNSLFYHAHRPEFTAQNVYKGQIGFCRIFDEVDAGDENLVNGTNLRLPSGPYDVPLVFADKVFDANGQLFFDAFNLDGILGDKPTVNGIIQPYMNVACRRYRFRMVNGGPSRIIGHYLYNTRTGWLRQPFIQIASDGNLLERPVRRGSITHGIAERFDVVIDFNEIGQPGDEIILYNRFEQVDGRRPTGDLLNPGAPQMKFIIGSRPAGGDPSQVPAFLRTQPTIDLGEVVRERTFRFERTNGAWAINGRFFGPNLADSQALIRRGTTEIWNIENRSGGWVHPVHIHLEEHRILSRNGFAPPAHERGRKDVTLLGRNERARIFMRFRDFPDPDFNPPNAAFLPEAGRYVMHCHNTVHEDHAMMTRWDVVP